MGVLSLIFSKRYYKLAKVYMNCNAIILCITSLILMTMSKNSTVSQKVLQDWYRMQERLELYSCLLFSHRHAQTHTRHLGIPLIFYVFFSDALPHQLFVPKIWILKILPRYLFVSELWKTSHSSSSPCAWRSRCRSWRSCWRWWGGGWCRWCSSAIQATISRHSNNIVRILQIKLGLSCAKLS